MPPKALLLGITVLAIVIIIGGVAYTLVEGQSSPTPSNSGNGQQTPTGSTTPETGPEYPDYNSNDTSSGANTPEQPAGASVQEQIRDQGMTYLRTTKPETAQLMGNLTWYGGFYDLSPPGTEQYMYYTTNGFWSIIVGSQADSAGDYAISGTYFNAATMTVTFNETYKNGAFTLVNYSSQRNQGPFPMP